MKAVTILLLMVSLSTFANTFEQSCKIEGTSFVFFGEKGLCTKAVNCAKEKAVKECMEYGFQKPECKVVKASMRSSSIGGFAIPYDFSIDDGFGSALNITEKGECMAVARVEVGIDDREVSRDLSNIDPSKKFPCGLTGSTEDRIRDCSYQDSSARGSFVLVTRTKEFKEVHKDTKSGILWGHPLPYTMRLNHYEALKACKADRPEAGGISGLTWRLPSIEEYKDAETNGIRSAIRNMDDLWWSSSVSDRTDIAWLFDGDYGNVNGSYRKYYFAVRCVAQ